MLLLKVMMMLFEPASKEMRIDYPELAEIKEFASLKTKEMKFVWYYANRTSQYFNSTKGERNKVLACIYYSFGDSITDEEKSRYITGNFPQKIKAAIEKMEHFDPSARLKAKMAIEQIFLNLQQMIEIDDDMKNKIKEDLAMRKQYVELSTKVASDLPAIVRQMEEGFGLRESASVSKDGRGPTMMDILHMEDDD